MAELRYNPLLDDYTMVSKNRAKRPDMPKDFCPFCAGSNKVPDDFDVLKYDNDFPILMQNPPSPDSFPFSDDSLYHACPSYGKCEVILYSPNHYKQIHELSDEHVLKLVKLWRERFSVLAKDENIKYVLPFENRGKEVGTTMPHPHGQIYAYSKMPLRLRLELENARRFYEAKGKNIFTALREEEEAMGQRVIFSNEHFVVLLPYFCEYPYGCYIMPKRQVPNLEKMSEEELVSFASCLKELNGTFDELFDKPFPYMMAIYQAPVNSEAEYPGCEVYYQFHVKFFPPLRAENAIKYCASSETAAFVHGNPRNVEETAKELIAANASYLAKRGQSLPSLLAKIEKEEGQEALNKKLLRLFKGRYGHEGCLFFSPSRINIIGEHIDYNGGLVLPAAIEIGTYAVAIPNGIGKLRLKSLNIEAEGKISLDDLAYKKERSWMNYVSGVLKYMQEAGYQIGGLDILIYGNIPNGAGLSSSASLELLIGSIQNYFFNENKIPMLELVKIGKLVENKHIGVNSGIMDQFAIGMGQKDKAILLNTHTLEYEYVNSLLDDAVFVIMNTNKRRELADSKYNERRGECDKVLSYLREAGIIKPQAELCSLDENGLDAALKHLRSLVETSKLEEDEVEILSKRLRHVVSENLRVKQMLNALKQGDLELMGKLLNASHYSLADDYEVTGFALDAITSAARNHLQCFGARMTGAGFGGSAIALVKKGGIDDFVKSVKMRYLDETGLHADFYISSLGSGPQIIS